MNFGLVDALHLVVDPLAEKLTDGLELLQASVIDLESKQARTNELLERLVAVETAKLNATQAKAVKEALDL